MTTRLTRRAACLALLFAVVSIATGAAAQAQEASVKIREAALDPDGTVRLTIQPVGPGAQDLQADDLRIQESGETITDFTLTPVTETQTRSIVAGLVIDTSGSMVGEPLAATKAAAAAFVRQLADNGVPVMVVAFSDEPRVVSGASVDPGGPLAAIDGLQADGETALFDAVVLAAQELGRLESQPNLVVFTDGGDTVSSATVEDAIAAADAADVPVSAVTLVTDESDRGVLERLTGATGGATLATTDLGQLEAAFATVATEITTQYVVEYRADRADLEELDISVAWANTSGSSSDTVTVTNPRVAPPAPVEFYEKPSTGLFGSTLGLVIGMAGVFVAIVLALTLLLVRPGGGSAKRLDRDLAAYVSGKAARTSASSASIAQALRERAESLMASAPKPEGFDDRVQHRLDQAAWPLRTSEFLAIQLASGLVLGFLGLLLAPWFVSLLLFVLGIAAPWITLDIQRNRRRNAFMSRFPDTLQLLAGSLRAGYGIMQAMDAVGRESGPPTSEEFSRALTEARLGAPLEDALDGMADRLDSDDVRWVVLAIKIQREVGGNLAELLTTVARTLREREALRRQINVLSAEGKLSAIILIVLPFFLGLYLTIANPDYVRVLVEETIGWILIAGGALLMTIGVFWIRKMIQIEV